MQKLHQCFFEDGNHKQGPQPQYLLPSKIQRVHFSSVALLFILSLKRFIFQWVRDDEGGVCMINVYTSCTSGKPFMPGRRCLRSLCKKQSHDKRSPRCPDCVASAKPLPWREMFQIRTFWCFSRDYVNYFKYLFIYHLVFLNRNTDDRLMLFPYN